MIVAACAEKLANKAEINKPDTHFLGEILGRAIFNSILRN
jgi:hypothetical protein